MTSQFATFDRLCRANLNTAEQCARLALEGAERLLMMQMEAAQDLFAKGAKALIDDPFSPARPAANWPALWQEGLQRSVDLSRAWVEEAAKVQAESAHLFEEQAPLINRRIAESVRDFLAVARAAAEPEGAQRKGKKAA